MDKVLSRGVISVGVAAIFAACSGTSTPPTSAAFGRPLAASREGSSADLLYGSHSCGGLCVFSYPGLKPVGGVTLPSGTAGYLCSDTQGNVDRNTENLAVANNNSSYGSNVAIYAGASGSPIVYQGGSNLANIGGCGYDTAGNLYIAGENSNRDFSLAELPRGSSSLSYLTGPQPAGFRTRPMGRWANVHGRSGKASADLPH
jgi:hypothetical protein